MALIHVADPHVWPPDPKPVTVASIERLARRHRVAARALLEGGDPLEGLVRAAAQQRADLLVMGAVSRGGSGRSHIGGTAEAVIDAVGCDVLVVKPRGFKTSVTRTAPRLWV